HPGARAIAISCLSQGEVRACPGLRSKNPDAQGRGCGRSANHAISLQTTLRDWQMPRRCLPASLLLFAAFGAPAWAGGREPAAPAALGVERHSDDAVAPAPAVEAPPATAALAPEFAEQLLAGDVRLTPADRAERGALASFYVARQCAPVWVAADG